MVETTVAICDTEPVAIEGLRSVLESAGGLRVVAAENCLAAGLDMALEIKPEIFVLDKAFGMQAMLDALRGLRMADTGIRTVVWGAAISDSEALRMLNAGASGVVRKTATLEIIVQCLEAVASGSSWVEDGLIPPADASVRSAHTPLTARELQVAELIERGLTNRDIGRELGIRTGTVKIHLKHIFEKTGVRGRYGLALSGLRAKGLVLAPVM